MKVKVCGITIVEQMQHLANAGVDYAGIIFYPASKRYAVDKFAGLQAEIKEIAIKKIGVFVNAKATEVLDAISAFGLYGVQLHGDENAAYCRELAKQTVVIKAFRINPGTDIDAVVAPYADVCQFYLFDTATKDFGGSGEHFDWKLLERAHIGKPFFLSGGINVGDVNAVKEFKHLYLYSVDINSRFEILPGIKDLALVQTFLDDLNKSI